MISPKKNYVIQSRIKALSSEKVKFINTGQI